MITTVYYWNIETNLISLSSVDEKIPRQNTTGLNQRVYTYFRNNKDSFSF